MTSNQSPSLAVTHCLVVTLHCGSMKVFTRSNHNRIHLQIAYTVRPTTIIDNLVCSRFTEELNTRNASPLQSRHRISKEAMDIKRVVFYKGNILLRYKAKMISVYSINIIKTFYCVKRATITKFGSDIVRKYANNIIFHLIVLKHTQKLLTVITIYRNNP